MKPISCAAHRAAAMLCVGLAAVLPSAVREAQAGIPFVTDDPGTPEAGHYEMNLATQYTHRRGEDSGVLPSFELNYGATDNLQLHFLAGLAFDRQSPGGARFGSGDVELGVKYRFIEADEA